MGKIYYNDGSYIWTIGSKTYLKKAINILKKKFESDGFIFNMKSSNTNYYPK